MDWARLGILSALIAIPGALYTIINNQHTQWTSWAMIAAALGTAVGTTIATSEASPNQKRIGTWIAGFSLAALLTLSAIANAHISP